MLITVFQSRAARPKPGSDYRHTSACSARFLAALRSAYSDANQNNVEMATLERAVTARKHLQTEAGSQ